MADLVALARHWMNQTDKRKGLQLNSDQLALLNSIGCGDLLASEAAASMVRQEIINAAPRIVAAAMRGQKEH